MATYSSIRGRAAGLTGRRSECEALDRLIEAVRAGESRALVLVGGRSGRVRGARHAAGGTREGSAPPRPSRIRRRAAYSGPSSAVVIRAEREAREARITGTGRDETARKPRVVRLVIPRRDGSGVGSGRWGR